MRRLPRKPPACRPNLRVAWAVLALGGVLLPCCAGQDSDSTGEDTGVPLFAHEAVDNPGAGGSGNQTTKPTVSSDYNSLTKPTTSVSTGLSVRWVPDSNRCLARASSSLATGTPILLEPCAATMAQAWQSIHGGLSADGINCAGFSGNSNLVLVPCENGNVDWHFNGGSTYIYATLSTNLQILQPYDANGTYGRPLQGLPGNFGTLISYWNLRGIGASGGALISFLGDPCYCLTQGTTNVTASSCNPANPLQQWNLINGDLASSSGQCVVCDMSTQVVSLLNCSAVSNSSTNNQGWYVGNGSSLFYATPSADGRYYAMDWNAKLNKMGMAPSTNGNYWVFGGHR